MTENPASSRAELRLLLHRLEEEERAISARRRRLHQRIEFMRGGGSPTGAPPCPDDLTALDEHERAISTERRALHARIERIRTELLD